MEISDNLLLVAVVLILLLLSAFFSGSETALFSLPRSALAEMEKGGERQRRIASLLENPRMLLVTILFGNLLVNIANTSVVTALSITLFGERGVAYAMIFMTALILVFGEITPKSFALKHGQRFAPLLSGPLKLMMLIFAPIRLVLGWIADRTVEMSRSIFGESEETYGSSELATAVEMGHIDGVFDAFEKQILTKLFRFTETMVHEIHTPRVDIFSIHADTALPDAVYQVRSRGFTRVPVFDESAEDIVGILHARDLLGCQRDDKLTVRKIMREGNFVPETKPIRDLLGEMIAHHEHVALVLDEHGSFEGLVTLEDILEEIFGEIRDRREPRVEDFNLIDEDKIIVEGAMRLEDLNERFGTGLDSDEVETIAGYLIEAAGRIPREGESFRIDGLRFLVLSAETVRINKLKIEREKGRESEDGSV